MTRDEFISSKVWPDRCYHKADRPARNMIQTCVKCGLERHILGKDWNPDFSTWEGFGMLLKGMQERGDWGHFLNYIHMGVDITGNQDFPVRYINPIALRDAVLRFLGWEADHEN